MNAEILLRNRISGEMRKIRQKYPTKDMRKIIELLNLAENDEAVIEIRINADILE